MACNRSIFSLIVWYQSNCFLDHAGGVLHYVICFSATAFVDERHLSILSDQATVIFDVEFDI